MTTVACGPFILSSDFDSGNFLKVEYVQPSHVSSTASTSQYSPSNYRSHDHEINIWTRPDCFGTRFENGNRTWFYFSIRGGKSQGTVKLNVLNLNKQVKLFQQGMQPVYRVLPEKPEWERVQDKLLINETGEHVCSISFKQRLPDNPNASIYVAFTYPFSYHELCEFLNDLDEHFLPPPTRLNPLSDLPLTSKSMESDIYYHRECVCFSYERRRVELITISSMNGISSAREDRLLNLFPITNELRPFKFPEKNVVFMSARVHPGETPSSFVLNGFLRFILQQNDPRAVLLRRLFVFKFIPILNPDGVVRGHYRTDPRGVNLNRVYLNPSPHLHPPIYAARKLLLYYHHGYDSPDDYEYPVDAEPTDIPNDVQMDEIKPSENLFSSRCTHSEGATVGSSSASIVDPDARVGSSMDQLGNPKEASDVNQNPKEVKKPYTFVLSESNSLCAGCGPFIDPVGGEDAVMSVEDLHPLANTSSSSLNDSVQSHHQCAFEACDEDSVFYENLTLKSSASVGSSAALETNLDSSTAETPRRSGSRTSTGSYWSPILDEKRKEEINERKKKGATSAASGRIFRKKADEESSSSTSFLQVLPIPRSAAADAPSSPRYKLRSKSSSNPALANPVNYKISSPVSGPDSGLFLYLDMHGHTTKRGIFMYGNHFPEATTQAECMLLPRLMAINSPHFDFSACNFTERLMCMKDKRDGASREGSGRVACLKLTGLIRSYTLECNYNTGRIVNPVTTRPPAFGFLDSPSSSSYIPPKYTIGIFEGIGKALAESLLDLTGHNPWSRLGSTELRSMDGVRRTLVKRLKLSPEYKNTGSDMSIKKQSASSGFEGNPLLSSPPKVLKKPKTKVLVQPTPGGPLGPKRENQTLPAADAKASGSQYCKKLPLLATSVVECPPVPGCSATAKEEAVPVNNPPKISLKKVMKKKSLTKVPSNSSTSSKGNKSKKLKGKKKKKKSEKSSLEKLAAKK